MGRRRNIFFCFSSYVNLCERLTAIVGAAVFSVLVVLKTGENELTAFKDRRDTVREDPDSCYYLCNLNITAGSCDTVKHHRAYVDVNLACLFSAMVVLLSLAPLSILSSENKSLPCKSCWEYVHPLTIFRLLFSVIALFIFYENDGREDGQKLGCVYDCLSNFTADEQGCPEATYLPMGVRVNSLSSLSIAEVVATAFFIYMLACLIEQSLYYTECHTHTKRHTLLQDCSEPNESTFMISSATAFSNPAYTGGAKAPGAYGTVQHPDSDGERSLA